METESLPPGTGVQREPVAGPHTQHRGSWQQMLSFHGQLTHIHPVEHCSREMEGPNLIYPEQAILSHPTGPLRAGALMQGRQKVFSALWSKRVSVQ